MSCYQEGVDVIKCGMYEHRVRKRDGITGVLTAWGYTYFLEHNMPLTSGLDQRIRQCRLEFPRQLQPEPPREPREDRLHYLFPSFTEEV